MWCVLKNNTLFWVSNMPDVTLIAICVGYALYNAVRKTLPVALPLLMNALGETKEYRISYIFHICCHVIK